MKKHSFFRVQGKPFYTIGIQVHNSSSYLPEEMADTWNVSGIRIEMMRV